MSPCLTVILESSLQAQSSKTMTPGPWKWGRDPKSVGYRFCPRAFNIQVVLYPAISNKLDCINSTQIRMSSMLWNWWIGGITIVGALWYWFDTKPYKHSPDHAAQVLKYISPWLCTTEGPTESEKYQSWHKWILVTIWKQFEKSLIEKSHIFFRQAHVLSMTTN